MEAKKLNVGEEWFKTITQLTLSYRRNLDASLKPSDAFNENWPQQKNEEKLVQRISKQLLK